MRIMYCVNDISDSGGVERILSLKTNYLVEKYNYEVIILTWNMKNNLFFKFNSKIKIINLNIQHQSNYFKRQIIKIKKYIELRKYVKNNKIDILISTGFPIDILFHRLNKFTKTIYEVHVSKYSLYLNITYYKKIYRYIYDKVILKKYNKIVVLTKEDLNYWELSNIQVIPNCLTFFSNDISKCENRKLISIGRLHEQKGYDILIDVWNLISKKYPDWILEIYGEGSERENLQNKINEYGLKDSLLLKGIEKNIQEKYLESSIYVMSSRYEGFGMVLTEAMACGLPVVSFDCPCGPKDIIQDNEDGFIVKFGNIEQMAEKIEELILNDKKRKLFGKNAQKNIQRFSQDKVMNQWKELFENLREEENEK